MANFWRKNQCGRACFSAFYGVLFVFMCKQQKAREKVAINRE